MSYVLSRLFFTLLIFANILAPVSAIANDTYPNHPIRMIVPFEPGGNTDLVARLISHELSRKLKTEVVVENRPGGNTIIGSTVTAHAAPDGYTIMLTTLSLAINPSVYRRLPYDTLKDFTPITLAVTLPNVLVVNPALPVESVRELLAYAKARPGKMDFSASGIATSPDLSLRLFNVMGGIHIVTIPFKGGAPAMTAVISGQVQGQFVGLPAALPHIKSHALRALAVTSGKRSSTAPDIPTVSETIPGYEADNWFAVVGPAGIPRHIVARLQTTIADVLHSKELSKHLQALGAEPVGGTPEELAVFLKKEIDKYAAVVKETGVPVQ